jgi:predicted esterase
MRTLSVETQTHGRVLIEDAASTSASPSLLVGFHGYGQNAEDMLEDLKRIPGSSQWTLVSIQALHRFYARGQKTVASWMTREDREFAITDNIRYVNQVMKELVGESPLGPLVFVGFSQGVAMAYRAAVLGAYRPGCIVAVGGDLPPELRAAPVEQFPSIFIAAGDRDPYYTPAKVDEDEKFLRSRGLRHQVFRYDAGHEWTDELREQVHVALNQVKSRS